MDNDDNNNDDDNNESPLLIRIPNSDDADAVDRNVGEQLGKLTTEQQANMNIPTPAEVSRSGLSGDIQDLNAGMDQQNIELGRLQNNLEVAKAAVVKARAQGYVPNNLMNAFTAAANSYQYQADAIRRNTPDPVAVEAEQDRNTLISAYDSEKDRVVSNMQREKNTTKEHAEKLIDQLIEVRGLAAVLPIYARIKERMDRKYPPKSDDDA